MITNLWDVWRGSQKVASGVTYNQARQLLARWPDAYRVRTQV